MINREEIIKQVKETLPVDQRDRDNHINRSFLFAVADFSTRLMKQDRLRKETKTITADDRELTLTGADYDIESIYYLLYGTGDSQVVLEYADQDRFFKDYNSSDTPVGIPTYFTFIGLNDAGEIQIRFDCPAESATTMEVWYYMQMDDQMIRETEAPTLLNFTLAYFWGVGSKEGLVYHRMGTGLISKAKANAKRVRDNECSFIPSRFDTSIANIRQARRDSR